MWCPGTIVARGLFFSISDVGSFECEHFCVCMGQKVYAWRYVCVYMAVHVFIQCTLHVKGTSSQDYPELKWDRDT